jgi:RNA polymerase sigma-70 factor, ECF subfamily
MAMTISIDDRHLVESYQAGDTHAFADLVEAHSSSLLGHAIRRLGDRAAAEDAVQETFVRAYRALPRFDGDYRLGPWLHRILVNVCNDEGNRRQRESDKFDRFAADPFSVETAPGVEDELGLASEFDDARLTSAIESLPPSYREALNLRFVQELPYDEVARIAGVSEQNARARVSRARSAARTALRGVAAIPALFIPALRRGETVAAAASHGDGVRSGAAAAGHAAPAFAPAADAAMAAAPAVTPLFTKAIVGITLVAAVASPTVGTELVDRGRAIGGATIAAVESTPEPAPVVEVEGPAPANLVLPQATPRATGTADASTGAGHESIATDPGAPVALPTTPAKGGAGQAGAPSTTVPAVPAPIEVADGTLTITQLQTFATGQQLAVSGQASLDVGGRAVSGLVAGQLTVAIDDATGARRYTGLLIVSLGDGSSVELRLDLYAQPRQVEGDVDGQADEPVEPTAFDLIGSFRATSPESVSLAPTGMATGTIDLVAGGLRLSLTA